MADRFTTALSNVFVGREPELSRLLASLNNAAKGSGSFIIIAGEAGIGKTTLIRHFAAEAMKMGADFIPENFDESRSYQPYAPFLRIVERIYGSKRDGLNPIGDVENLVSTNDGQSREHGARTGARAAPWDMELLYSLHNEHGLMQQRLVSSLLKAARDHVLLIVLSDVHFAPLTAWQFIHYLAKSIGDHKILIVVTLRQDGHESRPTQIPVYADVLQRMNREGLVERIQLNRFDEKSMRKLIHQMFPRSDFASHFVPLLHEISGGLPDQAVKYLQLMHHHGLIFQQTCPGAHRGAFGASASAWRLGATRDGIWFNQDHLSKESLIGLMNDETDQQSPSKQIADLSPDQKRLLKYAALVNGPFDHLLLSAILKRPRHLIIKELLALKERKILYSVDKTTYQFKRVGILSAILEQIPADGRPLVHLEIATAIEGADYLNATAKIYQLAYHFSQSQDKPTAFRYLCQAGDLAIGNFAFPEAKDFYQRALGLLRVVSGETGTLGTIQCLLQAAWLDRVLGHWDDSIAHCKNALELCQGENDITIRNQVLIQAGMTYFRLNDWQNARACFEQCHADTQHTSGFDLAMANFGLGNVYFELAQYDMSRRHFEEALTMAREMGKKSLMANIFNNLGAIENVRGHRMRAVALYSQSIPLYESLGDNSGLARVYHNIGMTYADENDWKQANEFYGKSLGISDVMGLVPLKSITFLNRALALAHLQRFAEAREYNFKAHRLLERLKDELGMAEYHKIQGVIEREQRNWMEARTHFDEALQKFNALHNRLGHAETQYERGLLALVMEDHEEGIHWLAMALESFRQLGLTEKVSFIEQQLAHLQLEGKTI
jgi:tetratricopeptide (TPR) repeat protein/ABC-type dipeptide/oligopeptide/nickel transport system ATPase subunit